MATTRDGARLTEIHTAAQNRLAAETIQSLDNLWVLLTTEGRLTENEWLGAVSAVLGQQHQVSAETARRYYRAYRAAETGVFTGVREFGVVEFDEIEARRKAQIGLDRHETYLGRMSAATAASRAGRESAWALVEVALDGGRNQVISTVESDQLATGWFRVSDGDPCAFCALMLSRGQAYKSRRTASFAAHPNCNCTAEPSYQPNRFRDRRSAELNNLYQRSTRGHRDQLNAFRRAYERPQVARA